MKSTYPLLSIDTLETSGAILEIQDGNHGEKHPKSSDYVPTGIPFVMANDINDGQIDFSSCSRIPESLASSLRIGFAKNGDVLLTHKGTLGNVALLCNADPYVMLTPQVTYYRCNNYKLDGQFLYYAFKNPDFLQQMRAIGDQGTRPYIGITAQRKLSVVFPSIAVQRRIVDILVPYDRLIENNRRRMAKLEEAARLLYQEWFVRLRFPGHERTRIVNGVPEGWTKKVLGDICFNQRKAVLPQQLRPGTPYIGLEHMPRRSICLQEWGSVEDVMSSKLVFLENDILFGKIRPYFHKVGFALVDGVTSSDALVVRPVDASLFALILMTMSSDRFVAQTSQSSKEGSKMPRADWKQMKAWPLLIPNSDLLSQFEDVVSTITRQLRTLALQTRALRIARDLLLPRLMSGEIAV